MIAVLILSSYLLTEQFTDTDFYSPGQSKSTPITLRHVSSPYQISMDHVERKVVTIRRSGQRRAASWPVQGIMFVRYDDVRKEWLVLGDQAAYRINPQSGRVKKLGKAAFVATVAGKDVLIQDDGTSVAKLPQLSFLKSLLSGGSELVAVSEDLGFAVIRDDNGEANYRLQSLRAPYKTIWLGRWLADGFRGNLISVGKDQFVLVDGMHYSANRLWYIDVNQKTVRRIGSAFIFSGCFPFSTGKSIVYYNKYEGGIRRETVLDIQSIIRHPSKRK